MQLSWPSWRVAFSRSVIRWGGTSVFFSSVAADLALRLGPDSERSGRKVCKKYETLWLHKRGKSWKNQHNEKKHGNSDDTQISRPDLRLRSLISIDFPAPEMEPESAHVASAVSVP